MRTVFALILLLGLAACANDTPCPGREVDGGIGGTGECNSEIPAIAAFALEPEPEQLRHL